MEMSFKIRFVHQKQSNNIIKLTFDACIPILMENTRIFTPKSAQTIRTPFGAQIKENPDFRLKSRKIWIFQIFEAMDKVRDGIVTPVHPWAPTGHEMLVDGPIVVPACRDSINLDRADHSRLWNFDSGREFFQGWNYARREWLFSGWNSNNPCVEYSIRGFD